MSVRQAALAVLACMSIAGCAEFGELISFGDDEERAAALAQAEQGRLWEMTLMAGRYGVMLGQAREILNLPEPKQLAGEGFPSDAPGDAKQREALAAYQASVAAEFLSDVDSACKRKRVKPSLRKLACEQLAKAPADLRAPVKPEMQALALRNDQVGEFIMPWWDAVCATVPKPKGDEMPVCIME